ncbi:UPF0149 family protein [Fastidiosibacter lacustris]|uniref:UPF0149 family protein n=1 Tax=Fastidiosibacter lacustris TaxID=2056695 RepID=UPI000E34458E|nr:UPF0149 family protein [Fastidiosibacter lacustris]
MKNEQLPSYQAVTDALRKIKALSEASEAHALLCALFTVGAEVRIQAWMDSLMAEPIESGDIMAQAALKTLSQMYQVTKAQFLSHNIHFDLLLPIDEEVFYKRIDALAMWCQGYLSGLGLIELDYTKGSAEVQEAISDLLDVSRLQYDDEVTGQEDEEKAYVELVEYTKVAVLLIHSEFGLKSFNNF